MVRLRAAPAVHSKGGLYSGSVTAMTLQKSLQGTVLAPNSDPPSTDRPVDGDRRHIDGDRRVYGDRRDVDGDRRDVDGNRRVDGEVDCAAYRMKGRCASSDATVRLNKVKKDDMSRTQDAKGRVHESAGVVKTISRETPAKPASAREGHNEVPRYILRRYASLSVFEAGKTDLDVLASPPKRRKAGS